MYKVFIDGEAGTTGLQVRQRLENHNQIELLSIDADKRKDDDAKKALMQDADVTILCLPDEAAKEAVKLAKDVDARVLDASSAHRVDDDWVFGLPELSPYQREDIKKAQFVSNPGCYSTGSILLLKPLLESGLNIAYNIHAVSGYSGGGKGMIETYESDKLSSDKKAYALYGLNFSHKHIPEIMATTGLVIRPTFFPSVINTQQGMVVQIAMHEDAIDDFLLSEFCTGYDNFGHALQQKITSYYQDEPNIRVHDLNAFDDTGAFIYATQNNNTTHVDCYIAYHEEFKQALLVAKYDNLGKGASGACVQNLNIMLGLDEFTAVNLV